MAVYAVGNLIVAREGRERPGAGGRKGRIEYQTQGTPGLWGAAGAVGGIMGAAAAAAERRLYTSRLGGTGDKSEETRSLVLWSGAHSHF